MATARALAPQARATARTHRIVEPAPESPATAVPWYRHGQGLPLYPPGDPRNDAWDARTDPPSAAGATPGRPLRSQT